MTNPKTAEQSSTENHTLPERYRVPKFTIFDEVMPSEWLAEAGQWLHSQRGYFQRGGDDGRGRYNYELLDVDEQYDPLAELKKALVVKLGDAIKQVGIEDFDLEGIDCHATLYHHGSHFVWHTDHEDGAGEQATSRRLAYCFYLHTDPKMFSGGELEFLDGTMVEAKHNRLVVYDPRQQHRVRRVECWSADFLHGRWAVSGWLHGS